MEKNAACSGNLIRTPGGKLAILDFGLMTEITENQKFGMIEAISHLVHRDYDGIGDDFKRLDFIPEEVKMSRIGKCGKLSLLRAALPLKGKKQLKFDSDLGFCTLQQSKDYRIER